MHLQAFVIAALLAAPIAATAADLPARYTVAAKPLKAEILKFALFSDALCTTPVWANTIAIENVDLIGSSTPVDSTNAAQKANTVELRATLTGVPATPSLYLQVTGTGVTPIGGACQAQASGLSAGGGGVAVPALRPATRPRPKKLGQHPM